MSTTTPRIRVALIGLSSTATTAWAASAHLPYLLSPAGKAKYEIVALLNSSEAAARAARDAFNLPAATTRVYGDPAALAADGGVDLVVCATRVDKHYGTVLASVQAGKDAFVEWPLAHDAAHARELAEAVARNGARSVVGLQGREAPFVKKLRALLEEGRIGKVLSSEVRGAGFLGSRTTVPEGLGYITDAKVGGNLVTIGFAHLFDTVQSVVGDLASVKGDFHLQFPENQLVNAAGEVVKTVRSDVPDLIFVSGKWAESTLTQKNATLHFRLSKGSPFPGEPALQWTITGEKGEIRVVSPKTIFLSMGDPTAPPVLEIHDFATGNVEKVEWDWEDWRADLPLPARNVGALYESYAKDKGAGAAESYAAFAVALKRHEQLEGLLAEWQP
ncbi:af2eb89a-6de0-4725-9bc7-95546f2f8b57 [Thermothielavioides terrestris]|uniref:Uncharacterized protein n=2 Tax=Thermothielavioides terrestris TaxID=2587410 RepID=G2QVA1_THETT|nr:uncharacterized protein THITE_2109390 [Thermothielavioides terrestris NRRL 8126]AEO63788.1 hypothetical protein THITE_2109390 [Thermothielavioides terrestris NRRL 8126]SPQ23485.1 af2eb89a-6de0-4725-9bc7-95546f2f8b57 [Thermothielavioides terrestris]